MENEEKYELLAEGEIKLPSNIGIIPFQKGFTFSEESIRKSLQESKSFQLINIEKVEPESSNAVMQLEATINYLEEEYPVTFYVFPTEVVDLQTFGLGNIIEDSELEIAVKQPYFLECSLYFGEEPLTGFHFQLKVLDAIVPEASLVIDFMPFRLLSGKWLRMTASSEIPPSPEYLYIMHSVYTGEVDKGKYWLHSHGLHRCGSPELEMINVSTGAQQMYDMLNITAKRFINGNGCKSRENFTVGYDGLGIQLCWIPWEEAVKDIPNDAPGGLSDRGEEGDVHREPSGVLMAVQEEHLVSPEIYAGTLADNPLYFISNEETLRMSRLAKERFHLFRKAFEDQKKSQKKSWNPFAKKNKEEWTFLVKLGLTVDDAKEEDEKEHLWFDVLDLEGELISTELVNEPYWIASMKKGDKKKFPLEVLTDWVIYSPDNTYTPDSIYQLK